MTDDGRLALDEPETRLPWLEPADEGFDEGVDWRRIRRFTGVVVVALLCLAVAIWFATGRISAPPEADGSVIEAPDTPYKVRPDDPGGLKFRGTGDTAYLVGEGVEQRGTLARASSAPVSTASPAPSTTSDRPADAAPNPAPSGIAVQVGAYSTQAEAQTGWQQLTARYEPLRDYDRHIVEGRADIGTVYRLQAMASTRAAAHALCRDLRNNGIECQVK